MHSAKYCGPFNVLKRDGKVSYKLEFLDTAQVHNVFHVSQLKKCKKGVVTTMGSFPHCRDEGLIAITPMAVLDKRMMKKKNKGVILKDKDIVKMKAMIAAQSSYQTSSTRGDHLEAFVIHVD
ncbi:hypothetical protein Tco_0976150 [Tanacetum coccineum]|uniref:Tf2-1-like SH3-like domain-containing protein n=1 Tax=Tanacetum coccineum TaxID=301880 RepID=A0ABQ5EGG1_9ASTR